MDYNFPKTEKLKSSKTIEKLFMEGKTYTKFPIKVFFILEAYPSEVEQKMKSNLAAFAVPKRNFKSAVNRNRVKRQLREAYRLNKHLLPEIHGKKFVMMFLILGKTKPKYEPLEKAMIAVLKKLQDESN